MANDIVPIGPPVGTKMPVKFDWSLADPGNVLPATVAFSVGPEFR